MTRRRLSATCAFALSIAAFPATGIAQPAGGLPDADAVSELIEILDESSNLLAVEAVRAATCTIVDGGWSCSDIRSARVCATAWSSHGTLADLVVRGESGTWWIGEAVETDVGWALVDVAWRRGEHVTYAVGGLASGDRLLFEELALGTSSSTSTGACPARPVRRRIERRADRASFATGTWRFESLRVGPWPLGTVDANRRGSTGLLPPTLRFADGRGELQGDVWIAPVGALTAAVDSTGRPSAGVALLSKRREAWRRLDAMAVADFSGDAVWPLVLGDLHVGSPDLHLSASLEHPAPRESWELRRLGRGALFRPWRTSAVGASLGGSGHALQTRLTFLEDPAMLDPQLGADITYSTAFRAWRSVWTVDFDHATRRADSAQHSSTLAVEPRLPIGDDGLWLTPSAALLANFSAVTASRGFDASTSLSLLGRLDTGVAAVARFGHLRHRIGPRMRLGAELYGVQQRSPEEGAPSYSYTRPEAWRFADVTLDQRFRHGDWSVDLPIGAYTDVLAPEGLSELPQNIQPHGRFSIAHRRTSLGIQIACRVHCDAVSLAATGKLHLTDRLSVWYALSDLDPSAARLAWASDILADAATAVSLIDGGSSDAEFAHHAGLGHHGEKLQAVVVGRLSSAVEGTGVDARASWSWPALGWGLGIHAAWRADDTVAVLAGLTLR